MHDRLLFILKKREGYWGEYSSCLSSGLRNSVSFIVAMLTSLGVEASMVEVDDNNSIDGEVTRVRPTHVIIEAFWVVPEKFDVLTKLHPDVRWIVRNHSEVPFLANEGIAFGWIAGYLQRGIEIMCNASRALADVRSVALAYGVSDRLVTYGPNFYPTAGTGFAMPPAGAESGVVRIGCFGAIRPLKNTMSQAIAAIAAARALRWRLEFHINATRLEGNGDPILKNLRQMFEALPQHTLVEHDWLPHGPFTDLVRTMDLVMQVSFSETFNIVAADAVEAGVPVVVSSEVAWLGSYARAEPENIDSITQAVLRVLKGLDDRQVRLHRQERDLVAYCRRTEAVWSERFAARALV
jgi:hypothetical protein